MKILFVCQQYIHSARWINQLKDTHHEIYVFDCLDRPIHEDLRWTKFIENWSQRKVPNIKGEYFIRKKLPSLYEKIQPFLEVTASEKLVEFIGHIKPDLVHSLEMQSETYPLLIARKKIAFKWAYFSWGSDLYLYQNKRNHRTKMTNVFSDLDYFFADNYRDLKLAKGLGFKGTISGVFPGGGGYHLQMYKPYFESKNKRNLILIKGYHHWAGRALYVLDALELIIGKVKDYQIYVYSAHDTVIEKILMMNNKYNLNIQYSSRDEQISHKELLDKFGKAKIAIGNNISDGVPNTLLEAVILGAFPIQSNPGGASEDYITHGKNGFLIEDPEDSNGIAKLIVKALNSDALLKSASKINVDLANDLAYDKIKANVLKAYTRIEID